MAAAETAGDPPNGAGAPAPAPAPAPKDSPAPNGSWRLADLSPDGVLVADFAGRVSYANAAFAALVGAGSAAGLIGRVLRGAGEHAGGATGPSARRWAAVREGRTVRASAEVLSTVDGRRVPVEISSRPVDVDGVASVVSIVRDVTDRVRRDSTLAELRQRHRLAFERAPIGQALVDLDGRWLAANPALCALLQRDAADVIGRHVAELTHPDDLEVGVELIEAAKAGDTSGFDIHKRYLRADGTAIWVELHAALVRDDAGVPLYLLTQVMDVTERREHQLRTEQLSDELRWANEALTEAISNALAGEARYRALVDSLPGTTVHLYDRQHRVTVAGGADPAQTGEAVLARTPDEVMDAEDARRVRSFLDDAFAGTPVRTELTSSSSGRHQLVDVVAIDPTHGGAPDEVLLVARDISDRKAREEALAAAHDRFSALIEHNSDLITITDVAGTIRYASPAFRAVTGRPVGDAVGSSVLDLIHPDDLAHSRSQRKALAREPGAVRCFPFRLLHADGSWRHVEVTVANRTHDPAVAGLVSNTRDVTDRVEAAARLAHQAMHDPLTDLPNRALFLDRLHQALARQERGDGRCAVLFVDLDRFKGINDSLGHGAGDDVLVTVAERIFGRLRPADSVARFGGDEFLVLVEDVTGADTALHIAERIRASVIEPIDLGEHVLTVGCSVGIALAGEGDDPDGLVQKADIALYRAKEHGRNRTELYDRAMQAEARRRMDTELAVREALDHGGIEVVYQPIVDLRTGGVASTEALARIRTGDGVQLGAGDFIPVAEDTGLIVALGAAVLDAACAQQAAWVAGGGPARVSVNVSARQLVSPDFVEVVASALRRHALHGSRLCLELTESTLIDIGPSMRANLAALKDLGVTLALDDFGTGWSSLAYLRRFPLDVLKIDRSFVAGLGTEGGDTEVVRAIISLGHALSLTTVAEGVETERQDAMLTALGCDHAQGFRYARPQPPEQMDVIDLDRLVPDRPVPERPAQSRRTTRLRPPVAAAPDQATG